MATKAELEVELAELRRQLAERDRSADEHPSDAKAPNAAAEPDEETQAAGEDWEELFKEVAKEFESLPQMKPLLVAAGIFAFGWLIGRSSR